MPVKLGQSPKERWSCYFLPEGPILEDQLCLSFLRVSWVCQDALAPERCPLCNRDIPQVCQGRRWWGDVDLQRAGKAHPGRVWGHSSGMVLAELYKSFSTIQAGRALVIPACFTPGYQLSALTAFEQLFSFSAPYSVPLLSQYCSAQNEAFERHHELVHI